MSKYALKLEQLVQTDKYGDILITIQYDGEGPKLITAHGEKIAPELKHSLDTVLGLVNFMLTKKISSKELSEQLETEPQDGLHQPINDLLMVVATSLREAPTGIGNIQPAILMEVMPEMIKEFTENATGAISQEVMPGSNPTFKDQNNQNPKQNGNQNGNSQQGQNQPNSDKKPKDDKGFFGGFADRGR